MDKLGTELSSVLSKLQGPGMDAAREAVRLDAMVSVMWGLFFWVCLLATLGAFWFIYKKKPFGDDGETRTTVLVVGSCVSFVFLLLCLINWGNPWTWAAFTSPDAVIASKLLRF